MLRVLADEQIDIAVAQGRERLAIPRLTLPPYLVQFERPEPVCERGEQTAGLDLGELPIIANQNELASRHRHGVGQPRERPRTDHAGLVNKKHRPGREGDPESSA